VNTWEEVCVDVARSLKMERYKAYVDVVRSYWMEHEKGIVE